MSNRILAYPVLNDVFDFDFAYQKCAERDVPLNDTSKKKFWMTAFSVKEKVLEFMLAADLIANVNHSSYLLTNYGIGKRMSGGYFPVGSSFVDGDLKLKYKGFEKSLLKLLRKKPTKRANISSFVNVVIDCRNEVKDEVRAYLIYLRDKGTIEIKEDDENPANNWWGDFLGHNPQAGGKVKELFVALPKDYLNKPWKDKGWNWLWVDLGKIIFGAVIGIVVTLLLHPMKASNPENSNQTHPTVKTQITQSNR